MKKYRATGAVPCFKVMATEFMDTGELARYLGISKIKAISDRARGLGPPFVRYDGRSIRYERTAVDKWIAEHTVHPTNGNGSEKKG